jgi:hypothetical protein
VTITGLDPQGRCTRLNLTTNPVLTPGWYWVGSFTGTAPGSGEWIWRGSPGFGASAILSTFSDATIINPPPGFTNKIVSTEGTMATTGTGRVSLGGGTDGTAWWNGATFGPDVEVFATIAIRPSANGDPSKVFARIINPGTATPSGYVLKVRTSATTDEWELCRIDNGVDTIIGGSDVALQEALSGDGFGLSIVGNVLTAWYRSGAAGQWVKLGSRVDSTYAAAGYVGIGISHSVGRLDDFGAGNIAATYGPTAPATFPAGATKLTYSWGIGINFAEQPISGKVGAVCGTFKCGAFKAGDIRWPFNEPFLDLVARPIRIFTSPPTIVRLNKAKLLLVPRGATTPMGQSPQMHKAIMLLQPKGYNGYQPFFALVGKAKLDLLARHANQQVRQSPPMRKAILLLAGFPTNARIAGLIPTDEVDVILVPTVPADGSLLLTPVVPDTILLAPTNEVVG